MVASDKLATNDLRYLDAATRLSRRHQGCTGTNPSVGCIIVSDLGHGPVIVGTGVTAKEGRPHAERVALSEAGERAKGATAYVTLEPCAHHGKTTPCVDALAQAGIARVVSGLTDPDERVNGRGHANLRSSGIVVDVATEEEQRTRPLNAYLLSKQTQRPFVTLKLAMSAEGIMGSKKQGNVKITCREANLQTHLMRARHDAILVGMGTVRADDPMLNCRLPGLKQRSPIRVVMSGSTYCDNSFQIFNTANQIPTLWTGSVAEVPLPDGMTALESLVDNGQLNLLACLRLLNKQGIQSVMVEGGGTVAASFLDADLVDELVIHLGGKPALQAVNDEFVISPVTPTNLPEGFVLCEERFFGPDKALRYRRKNYKCLLD